MKWFLILLFSTLAASQAHASCIEGELEVLGTVPADAASNVPLNTNFVLFAHVRASSATLNGRLLTRFGGNVWKSDELLEVDSDYTLVFESTDSSYEIGFRTGSELASPAQAPVVNGYQESNLQDVDIVCRELAIKTGCPDSGDATSLSFNVEGNHDLLIMNGDGPEFNQVWPKTCGKPHWYGYGDECFDIYLIEDGQISEPTRTCGEDVTESSDGGCGCQTGGGWVPGAILFLIALGVRRRTRETGVGP